MGKIIRRILTIIPAVALQSLWLLLLRTDYCVTAFRCSVFLGGIYYYKER
jgi:hypothetical protein